MIRWTAVMFAVLLAGCSSVLTLPAQQRDATGQLVIGESGGSLTGAYSGTETGGNICALLNTFTFSGRGAATFLRRSTESGSMTWNTGFSCNLRGSATITSIRNPANSVTVFLRGSVQPCDPRHPVSYTVSGGTGRFAHASGSGSVQFACPNNAGGGNYTDQWSGTLTF